MPGYAVIDTETTGFGATDRVIEVGVVLLDDRLVHEGEWSTLINPGRGPGPTWVHGITSADLVGAPAFRDMVNDLMDVIAGRTLVGHNLKFDIRMLGYELTRCGMPGLPDGLCTLKIAGGTLTVACKAAGVQIVDKHRALGDARATAELFRYHWSGMTSESKRLAM